MSIPEAGRLNSTSVSEFNSFLNKIQSWPSSAAVNRAGAQRAGQSYIIDEKGNVLGVINTSSYLGRIPGMTYVGNPWGNGDYNQTWIGPGSMTYNGMQLEVVAFVSVSPHCH